MVTEVNKLTSNKREKTARRRREAVGAALAHPTFVLSLSLTYESMGEKETGKITSDRHACLANLTPVKRAISRGCTCQHDSN